MAIVAQEEHQPKEVEEDEWGIKMYRGLRNRLL